MNYKELYNKYNDVRISYHINIHKFKLESLLREAQIIVDTEMELENMGNNLTVDDFPVVKELVRKRAHSFEMYLLIAMKGNRSDLRDTPQERIEWEKQKLILMDEAIKGNIDF